MKIIETIADLAKIPTGCVLTIGNFDGVHIGHQHILSAAGRIAAEKEVELAAMTFEPHPAAVLHPEKSPPVLTSLKLKTRLLAGCGVQCLIVLKDSSELMQLSPRQFVEEFLVGGVRPAVVVEGEDFNFGFNRTGNVHTLRSLGLEKGFAVVAIESKRVKLSIGGAVRVSSTLIRNLLQAGKVADAAVALTRPYRLMGPVIAGEGRGAKLGFPTANIQPTRQIIPADGVYAAFVQIGDTAQRLCRIEKGLPAAVSIGSAETFGTDRARLVEAHILAGGIRNLHSQYLAVDFVRRIRDQQSFAAETDLAEQIAKDCHIAKEILNTGFTN
ncbi:MAG TPA: bifunctional riboflavin kinase/FAD synthetase [Sedimentisphaerales bacterium]|nr:bifunctional riboflavin kinase/FAD synthetase [Sedimentisphaerales bacterium]